MFDWLKNLFGGGNSSKPSSSNSQKSSGGGGWGGSSRSSSSSSSSNSYNGDNSAAEAERRRREEEERKRKEEEERKRQERIRIQQERQKAQLEQFTTPRKMGAQEGTINPLTLQKVKTPVIKDTRNDTQKELDALAASNLEKSRKQAEQGQNWIQRNVLNRGSNEERAKVDARTRAVNEYQEKHGWNADKDVLNFSAATLKKAGANSQKSRDTIENTKKAVDVMRYIPGAGLGELGANAIRGNFSGSKEADDTLLREQFDLNQAQIASLPQKDRDKYLKFAKGGLAAGVLDVVGLGAGSLVKNTAKGGIKQALQATARGSVKDVAKQLATKQGAKMVAKNAAVGATAGGVIGFGGAKAMGADNETALEAGVRGAGGGAFGGALSSPLDMAASSLVKNKAARNSVQNAIQGGNAATIADAATKTASRQMGNTVIPGSKTIAEGAGVPEEPAREIAPGTGVKTRNTEPSKDNTPAYANRTPQTVGAADTQQRLTGESQLPDSTFDADARAAEAPDPMNTDYDIPAYIRRNAEQRVTEGQARLQQLDEQIAGAESMGRSQIRSFEDRRAIADAYQVSPERGRAMERMISSRGDRVDQEEALKRLLLERSRVARSLADAEDAMAAQNRILNPTPAAPVSSPTPAAPPRDADDAAIMADFQQAIDATAETNKSNPPATAPTPEPAKTKTDLAEAAQTGDLRVSTRTDADGNPTLRTDAEAVKELNEAGLAVQRGDSVVDSAEEQMQSASETAARREVSGSEKAPLTRDRALERIRNDAARADVEESLRSFEGKKNVNIADSQKNAMTRVREQSTEELISNNVKETVIKTPDDFFEAVATVERLGDVDVNNPAAVRAMTNAIESIRDFQSKAGTNLRMAQELFKDMPAPLKKAYLVDRVERKIGADLQDVDRATLISHIDSADAIQGRLGKQEAKLEETAQRIVRGGEVDEKAMSKAVKDVKKLRDEHEFAEGRAFEYSQELLNNSQTWGSNWGSKASQAAKTSMLSSPLRRAYDLIATGGAQISDVTANNISGLMGRALNKLPGGRGGLRESRVIEDTTALVKGNVAGVGDTVRGLVKDQRRIGSEGFMGELQKATRANAEGAKRTRAGRIVGDLTEAATNATRGQYDQRIRQLARQEGQQLGLKGKDLNTYTRIREAIPDINQKNEATQYHLRTNNLHNNELTASMNRIFKSIENQHPNMGRVISTVVAPFRSWQFGNLNRLFTDKNIAYNAYKVFIDAPRKQDPQMAIDNMSKAMVNAGEGLVLATLASQTGLISDTDDNGEDWAAPYVQMPWGKVPVATFGVGAGNMIVGHNLAKLIEGGGEDITGFVNGLGDQFLKFAGVQGTLGGENPVQTLLGGGGSNKDFSERAIESAGNMARSYIPASALMNDVNSFLNMEGSALNPTGERSKTRADETYIKDDGTEGTRKDFVQTELNRLQNQIPGLSQQLPRAEGKTAKNPLDRITGGTHANDASRAARAEEQAKVDEKAAKDTRDKSYREMGAPKTDDGIRKSLEEGDWDKAIAGQRWALERAADDGELSEETRANYEKKITQYEITRDNGFDYETIKEYNNDTEKGGITLTAWREMLEEDPERAARLAEYDQLMVDAGVKTKNKYYPKKSGSGGGRGGRGGGGGSSITPLNYNFATNNISFSPDKIAYRKADVSDAPIIPVVERVPNYDTSRLKKISVKKGVQI